MTVIYRGKRLRILLFVLVALATALRAGVQLNVETWGERAGRRR
jgi:hypothetical protein